jgi:protein TonB
MSMPVSMKKKAVDEFFTRLVSPEELHDKEPFTPSIPEEKPAPLIKPGRIAPAPKVEEGRKVLSETESAVEKDITDKGVSSEEGLQKKDFESHLPTSPSQPIPSLRERLFDEGIIGDLAKRDVKKGEKKDKIFTFDAKEYKFLIYNRRLKERIESIWIYPPDAVAKGIYGDLVIKFSIKKNGRLDEIHLIRTSGYKSLDDAAIKALKDGEPYWPLPDEWNMETYTIVGHFIYTIHGYYIR